MDILTAMYKQSQPTDICVLVCLRGDQGFGTTVDSTTSADIIVETDVRQINPY